MALAIELVGPGGPEMLRPVDRAVALLRPGEALIRHEVIGVNFIDVYQRSGLYPLACPSVIGVEAAGIVEAVAPDVVHLRAGMRVAYAGGTPGAYADVRALPASRLIALPDAIASDVAAASFLKGLTAHMLLHKICAVGPGDVVLVHAGAGGLGQILLAWGRSLGATMIATVGSTKKVSIAAVAGAHHVILHTDADWVGQVRDLTGGHGVRLACDGIGGAMLERTLSCVRPFGIAASLGQAGGPIPPIAIEALGPARSIALARPSVMAYANDPDLYGLGAAAIIAFLDKQPAAPVATRYPLTEAGRAHEALESGRSSGSLLLIP